MCETHTHNTNRNAFPQTFAEVLKDCGTGGYGCEICKPTVGAIFAQVKILALAARTARGGLRCVAMWESPSLGRGWRASLPLFCN